MKRVGLTFTELQALAKELGNTVYYISSDKKYDLFVYDSTTDTIYVNTAPYKAGDAVISEHYNAFTTMVLAGTTSTSVIENEESIFYQARMTSSIPVPGMRYVVTPVKKTSTADIYTASLNYTTDFGQAVLVNSVMVKSEWDMYQTQGVSIKVDNGTGANYDTVIDALTFAGGRNVFYQPGNNLLLTKNDELNVSFANTGVTMSTDLYVTVIAEAVK